MAAANAAMERASRAEKVAYEVQQEVNDINLLLARELTALEKDLAAVAERSKTRSDELEKRVEGLRTWLLSALTGVAMMVMKTAFDFATRR
jgi:hypothetical protein